MDEFVNLVMELENSDIEESDFLSRDYILVNRISDVATRLFIVEGRCNWDTIQEARDLNINIFPIEQDRFGWLIGGIHTKKGVISFD